MFAKGCKCPLSWGLVLPLSQVVLLEGSSHPPLPLPYSGSSPITSCRSITHPACGVQGPHGGLRQGDHTPSCRVDRLTLSIAQVVYVLS